MEYTVHIMGKITEECVQIRQEVFVEEQGFIDEFDDTDKSAFHAIVYDGKKAIATGRVFAGSETIYHIGRVAVLKEYRGKHAGEAVMAAMEQKAKMLGAEMITLSAQCQASGFYKKIGYTETDDFHLDQHCPHVTMTKIL